MKNPLIQLIATGRVKTLAALKATYHKLVMRTHPDAVESDALLSKHLAFSSHYEEAKDYLRQNAVETQLANEREVFNHQLAFYRQLRSIESLEMPYAFHPEENVKRINLIKKRAVKELSIWKPDIAELYAKAGEEYLSLKSERPMGPYLKHALALNVRPMFHDIIAFHLTGRGLYATQAQQNITAVMHRLSEKGCHALCGFIAFLLDDIKNGAAVLD